MRILSHRRLLWLTFWLTQVAACANDSDLETTTGTRGDPPVVTGMSSTTTAHVSTATSGVESSDASAHASEGSSTGDASDTSGDTSGDTGTTEGGKDGGDARMTGSAAKGYLEPNSIVRATPIDARGQSLGVSHLTRTEGYLAQFYLADLATGLHLVEAEGGFWRELDGTISMNSVSLQAVAQLDAQATSEVQVNVLSHLTTPRTLVLHAAGLQLDAARAQASAELYAALSRPGSVPEQSCNSLRLLGDETKTHPYLLGLSAAISAAASMLADAPTQRDEAELLDTLAQTLGDMGTLEPLQVELIADAWQSLDPAALAAQVAAYQQLHGLREPMPALEAVFDSDGDRVVDLVDNCPWLANPDQRDGDQDGIGDACDPCVELDGPGQCACGNGRVDAFETCDDGNELDDDGCDRGCQPSRCGDEIVDEGEQCDAGGDFDSSGCTPWCRRQPILLDLGQDGQDIQIWDFDGQHVLIGDELGRAWRVARDTGARVSVGESQPITRAGLEGDWTLAHRTLSGSRCQVRELLPGLDRVFGSSNHGCGTIDVAAEFMAFWRETAYHEQELVLRDLALRQTHAVIQTTPGPFTVTANGDLYYSAQGAIWRFAPGMQAPELLADPTASGALELRDPRADKQRLAYVRRFADGLELVVHTRGSSVRSTEFTGGYQYALIAQGVVYITRDDVNLDSHVWLWPSTGAPIQLTSTLAALDLNHPNLRGSGQYPGSGPDGTVIFYAGQSRRHYIISAATIATTGPIPVAIEGEGLHWIDGELQIARGSRIHGL